MELQAERTEVNAGTEDYDWGERLARERKGVEERSEIPGGVLEERVVVDGVLESTLVRDRDESPSAKRRLALVSTLVRGAGAWEAWRNSHLLVLDVRLL